VAGSRQARKSLKPAQSCNPRVRWYVFDRKNRSAPLSSPQPLERRLSAILAADVAGYSRLTGLDEEGTHAQLQDHLRCLVHPRIAEHRGRVVKNTGDGLLAEFSSVVDALRCALDVQRGMSERNAEVPQPKRIEFRIGINVGDIIIDRDDIFGDGVNVAARLEGIAEPGGICISEDAHRQVRGKLKFSSEDIGERKLKNISEPVRVYRVRAGGGIVTTPPNLTLADKLSVAVLPFENMSGDPEQEYFADGIVEEIITALSRFQHLFIIARSSSFTYKGRAVDVKQVGRELGVAYVLEGSIRQAATQVRITAQLIDALTGVHLWAHRFDGALEDIFGLQDQITASVVGAVAPKLEQVEIERAKRKPTKSLDAYDCYFRGMAGFHRNTEASITEAINLFYNAVDLDPDYAAAYGMAAWCYARRKTRRWTTDPEWETAETARLARKALELGQDDAVALSTAGYALAYVTGEVEQGAVCLDRAVELNPNLSIALGLSGWVKLWLGDLDKAIDLQAHAMRLTPRDPQSYWMESATALAHLCAGRYAEASVWAGRALSHQPNQLPSLAFSAASDAHLGRLEEARKTVARMRELEPSVRISDVRALGQFRRNEHFARFADGLRKAGLPE
jgi:TolB-like protein/class 3 adenylate cyclase/Tfp pilus assembly protein PilF